MLFNYSAHDGTVDIDSRGGFRAFAYQVLIVDLLDVLHCLFSTVSHADCILEPMVQASAGMFDSCAFVAKLSFCWR